ncbi:hypothetical protein BJY01DRAFT_253963 [Aspergillus pseudoustus]|uniref:Uncharacterized protein n=1 Tax=Aspergillus pseudoustus TaxID=1810923 RepID=A0ABR4IWV7_9EURO
MGARVTEIDTAPSDTLAWLHEEPGPGLSQWLRADSSGVFWIQGKAGSGNSTAMKFLLESPQTLELLNGPNEDKLWLLVGSFFTGRNERIQASWLGILHDMVCQVLKRRPALMAKAVAAFLARSHDAWDMDTLEQLLLSFFNDPDCESIEQGKVKIIAASRPRNDLRDLFAGDETFVMQDWTRGDIETYIAGRLSQQPRWKELVRTDTDRTATKIKQDISKRAQGVFLWVRLVLDELADGIQNGSDLSELDKTVSKFPDDLDDFFSHMLGKVERKHYQELVIIVETLLRSRTTPTPEFLLLVLQSNTRRTGPTISEHHEEYTCYPQQNMDSDGLIRRLQSRCGGLVEIVPMYPYAQNTDMKSLRAVQFLHQTVKEYFLERKSMELFMQSITHLAPGVQSPNGHFFVLQAYLQWLRAPDSAYPNLFDDEPNLPGDIVFHASRIELELHMSPTQLLTAIDPWMAEQSDDGVLWPILRSHGPKLWWPDVDVLPGQILLITAPKYSLGLYIKETSTGKMMESIRASGVIQFGYLPCNDQDYYHLTTGPLLGGVELLVKCGVDVAQQRIFDTVCPPTPLDALGIFVSAHAQCSWSNDDSNDKNGHTAVLGRLLELGTNPCGFCKRHDGKFVCIAEYFLHKHIRETRSIHALNLLWDQVSARSLSLEDMFHIKRDRLFELTIFKRDGTPETARWLLDHGATISSEVAANMYKPFAKAALSEYGTKTFAGLVPSSATKGVSQEILERSLLNIYEYDLDGETVRGYKVLLANEFRRPHYYEIDARGVASLYNLDWPVPVTPRTSFFKVVYTHVFSYTSNLQFLSLVICLILYWICSVSDLLAKSF